VDIHKLKNTTTGQVLSFRHRQARRDPVFVVIAIVIMIVIFFAQKKDYDYDYDYEGGKSATPALPPGANLFL
jgi:hypothetical protein